MTKLPSKIKTKKKNKGLNLTEVKKVTAILGAEIRAIEEMSALIEQPDLGRAVDLICKTRGRVVISGVGKPGIIGQRIAASLRSTGRPSFYLHPVEAIHGDLGLVTSSDVALLLSRSGETAELLALVPTLRRIGIPIVAATCRKESSLAGRVDCHLNLGDVEEIKDLGEFPTVSNTVFQVLGDILTVLVFKRSGLSLEDLRFLHPGGVIGRQATLRVGDIMHSGSAVPKVPLNTDLRDALVIIMEERLGLTCVIDDTGRLCGLVADGDIKRILHHHGDINDLTVSQVMTTEPKTIRRDELLLTALSRMENNPGGAITSLVVVDDEKKPIGIIHIHDILRASPTHVS